MATYQHKIMQRGDSLEIAKTVSGEVSLRFRGYRVVESLPVVYDPADLELTDHAMSLIIADGTSESSSVVDARAIQAISSIAAAKADLVGGVIPTSQIPALAITTGQAVVSRSALLALSNVQPGDIGVIASGADKGTYILLSAPSSTWSNWLLLSAPTDVVLSVNGQNGTVVLGKADVGLGSVVNVEQQPLDSNLTTIAGLAPTTGSVIQAVGGSWASRTAAQLKTSLGLVKADVGLANLDNVSDYPSPIVGAWYFSATSGSASATLGNNNLRMQPFVVKKTTKIDRLSIPVSVAGQSGSVVRLGIYTDTGSGYPGNLVVDSGPLAGDVVATPQATVDVTLTPGIYWIGGVVQGGSTTQPTIISATASPPFPIQPSGVPPSQTGTVCGYTMSVTGALPATFSTTISTVGAAPRVSFRVAA